MSDLDVLRELTGQLRPPGYDDLVAVARKRRRRFVVGAAIGAAVVVLGVGVAGAALSDGQRALAPTQNPPPNQTQAPDVAEPSAAVFSVGTTVYLDQARTRVNIDDQGIRSLHYTSAGVLVRHGDDGEWDGGGPQRFSLIGPDGAVDRLNVTLRDRVYATEPSQPYLAYLEETEGGYEVVVRDLRDDVEIARTVLPPSSIDDSPRWLEVSLSGGDVFVSTISSVFVVDWRAGSVTDVEAPQPFGYGPITAGRSITADADTMHVVDVRTGDVLLSIPRSTATGGEVSLSPDGRFVVSGVWGGDRVRQVYDIDTGEHVTLPEHDSTRPTACQSCGLTQYGWTGEGDLFDLTKDVLRICDSATGTCTSRPHGITLSTEGWQSLRLANW